MSESVAQTPGVDWWLVVPVKGGGAAKTRLVPPAGTQRGSLARALALDTVTAAAHAVRTGHVVVVTGSRELGRALAGSGCLVVADPGTGLNDAVRAGVARVPREPGVRRGVAVLLGDLPAAREQDVRAALSAAAGHDRAVVPDHHAHGTVLLTAVGPHPLTPAFGPGSAARHTALGHHLLALELPRLRTDVDDSADLAAVVALGVGPHTARALGLTP
ncbi:MAG: 2-phospho-L-lactate guanylyltransferase [Dermatophilaceae bacterium]